MIARWQRWMVVVLLALASTWLGVAASQGAWGIGLLGVVAVAFIHAPLMLIELVLVRRVNRADPAPPATVAQLLRAGVAEVVTAWRVFGWRQPFRSRAIPDHLPDHGTGPGVLLVHGFMCNRGIWNPWIERLRDRGIPVMAIDLEPPFASIGVYAAPIEAAVHRLSARTGRAPIVVAHSMGGLAVRAWLVHTPGAAARVAHVVTVGTPHRGTWLARFAYSLNGREMRVAGTWLAAMAERERTIDWIVPFTCFYGHCDNIVFPASTATLPHADNRHLPGVAHVDMLFEPAVLDEVIRLRDALAAAPAAGDSARPEATLSR